MGFSPGSLQVLFTVKIRAVKAYTVGTDPAIPGSGIQFQLEIPGNKDPEPTSSAQIFPVRPDFSGYICSDRRFYGFFQTGEYYLFQEQKS